MDERPYPTDRQWRIDRAGGWLRSGGSVLFLGNAPAAEATAMVAAIAAQSGAVRLLHGTARPERSADHYQALAGLLGTITDQDLAALPQPQRAILSGAPFRNAPRADYFSPAGVRLATLNLCRRLARGGRLLLILENLHHLDRGSAVPPGTGCAPARCSYSAWAA
jgi:hypothetical protein